MININNKKNLSVSLSLALGVSATALLAGCGGGSETSTNPEIIDPSQPVSDWQLVWSDEFDGDAIDTSKWNHEVNCDGGGNQEQQCYTDSPDNSYLKDGKLNIVALHAEEDAEKPYTSARLTTQYKGDFKYGRIEMSAKLPSGQGSWPAFWMMPTDSEYGVWPRSGEIDIMEAVNLKAAREDGSQESHVHGTLHYAKDGTYSGKEYMLANASNPADDFHTYAIEWQEGEVRWYVDGYLYATQRKSELAYNGDGHAYKLNHKGWYTEYYDQFTGELNTHWDNAPFDQDFFLILNYAVGGDWPINVNEGGINGEAFGTDNKFEVDYVRVYQCASNPETGKGCETVRPGYDDLKDALVEGKAPTPIPPKVEIENLTIFDSKLHPNWDAWDCCTPGDQPETVIDDERGEVVQFVLSDSADDYEWGGTVFGFNTKDSANPLPYDASGLIDIDGYLTLSMKVVTPPVFNGDYAWILKIASAGEEVEFPLVASSLEGIEPVVGHWQTYTIPLATIAEQMDITAIDVVMIFPTWGSLSGEFWVDDVAMIGEVPSPELILFEDAENGQWPLWGDSHAVTDVIDDDEAHGAVAQVQIPQSQTVMGFNSRGAGEPFDASGIASKGIVQFEMKVISLPDDASANWYIKLESNASSTAADAMLTDSIEGMAPTAGDWQTYTFKLSDFEAKELDLAALDIFMIFPDWGAGAGAEYLLDNVKIFDPTANATILFDNELGEGWALFGDSGPTPTIETEDDIYGAVIQYTIDATPTVMGLDARPGKVSVDVTGIEAEGVIRFDMKVTSMPADTNAQWFLKLESSESSTGADILLNDSNEGVLPALDQWQTYTFPISTFVNKGLDVSAIDVFMLFPSWGAGKGAVYRVDNIMFY